MKRTNVHAGALGAALLLAAAVVAADGVVSWKGVPYAAPPVGDLRWRAPQPVAPWTGVREAGAYGHDCMQLPFPPSTTGATSRGAASSS